MIFLSIFFLSLQLTLGRADLLTYSLFSSFDAEKFLPKDFKVSPTLSFDVISQRVDHFNPQNLQVFDQIFITNDEFFQPGGPIVVFLYISPVAFLLGGSVYLSFGPVYDFARELNGTLVAPQHRYFEGSRVTEDLSKENLRFLSVCQVLEDLAHMISKLKERSDYEKSGVIIVGMDYGASLATWFAQKYPHLVSGIWASGGRVHSTLETNQPIKIVEKVLQKFGSTECWNRTENAFRQVEELIANNQSTILERTFRLCFPLPYTRDPIDLWIFFQVLGSYYYTYAEVLDAELFDEITCGELLNAPVQEDFEALAYALGFWTIPPPLCFPISFDRTFRFMSDIQHGSVEADQRILLYTYCTELGYFYHSGEGETVFGPNFPVELLTEACMEGFGFTRQQIEKSYSRFNVVFGGRKPAIRNAYFTNGEYYPWIHQNVDPEQLHESSVYEIIPDRGLMTELGLGFEDPLFDEVRARVLAAAKVWLGIEEN